MTEPTRDPESGVVPAGTEPEAHGAESDTHGTEPEARGAGSDTHGTGSDAAATGVPYPGADPLPWIKRAPSRRLYDVLLLVPFICVGASVGTLAISTGLFRHLGLVVAGVILFAWIRAGLAITRAKHTQWLTIMGSLVVVFLVCGYLSKFA